MTTSPKPPAGKLLLIAALLAVPLLVFAIVRALQIPDALGVGLAVFELILLLLTLYYIIRSFKRRRASSTPSDPSTEPNQTV